MKMILWRWLKIIEDVNILITGDKDFDEVEIEKPEIMSPYEFVEKYL